MRTRNDGRRRLASLAFGAAALALAAGVAAGAVPGRVKVVVAAANVRSAPKLDARVIKVAAQGTLLDVADKSGDWYAVNLPATGGGKPVLGFVHKSVVSENLAAIPAAAGAPDRAVEPRTAVSRVERSATQEPYRPARRPAGGGAPLFRGFYAKLGAGSHWLLALGTDFPLGRSLALGIEVQPYTESYSEIDLSVMQLGLFANVRGGIAVWRLRPYAGAGAGAVLSYAHTTFEGKGLSSFRAHPAVRAFAGLELPLGGLALILEYQGAMIMDPTSSPDPWLGFFAVGLRF